MEEPDVILFHKNSGRGMPPNPRNDRRAPMSMGAERRGRITVMAHTGRAGAASRSTVASAPPPRFRGSIIRREDVEFLGREPETGVLLPLLGSSSCVYRRSCGHGFRQTALKTPRMAVRAVFRARQGVGEHDRDGCHPVGQRRRLRADPQALARFTARLPAGRFDEDHVDRVVGHHGATLGRGPRDGARGLEDLAARRSRGGPESPGSEGAQPPASLARGHAECGPSEYAGLSPKRVWEPSSRTRQPEGAPNASSRLPVRRKAPGTLRGATSSAFG